MAGCNRYWFDANWGGNAVGKHSSTNWRSGTHFKDNSNMGICHTPDQWQTNTHTLTHTDARALDQQWHLCVSAAVRSWAESLFVFCKELFYLSEGIPHSPWLYLLRRWLHMGVWVSACVVFLSLQLCLSHMNHCQWKGRMQTCKGQIHQAKTPGRREIHKSPSLSSRLLRAGLGFLTTEQYVDSCADNMMWISNAFFLSDCVNCLRSTRNVRAISPWCGILTDGKAPEGHPFFHFLIKKAQELKSQIWFVQTLMVMMHFKSSLRVRGQF